MTRKHYDLDPRIEEKRVMLLWWSNWLEEQCAAAIAADSVLSDQETLREACYKTRYGEHAWQRKLTKARETSEPIWVKRRIEGDAA